MSSVTHLAGPMVEMNDRRIQRCMVCGAILINIPAEDRARIGQAPPSGSWSCGTLVHVEDDIAEAYQCKRNVFSVDYTPKDFCMDLVERGFLEDVD